MIKIDVARIRLGAARLKQVRKRVADTADGIYRQKVYYLFEQAVRISPQFTGDFASNWNISVDGKTPTYRQWADKAAGSVVPEVGANGRVNYRVHQAGDLEAVNTALARGRGQLNGVTRASRIRLVNATPLYVDDTGQFMKGPDGQEKLRPQNVIPTGTRIEVYVRMMAENIPVRKQEGL